MDRSTWIVFGALALLLLTLLFKRSRAQSNEDVGKSAPPAQPPVETTKNDKPAKRASEDAALPTLAYEEDEEVDPTKIGAATKGAVRNLQPPTKKIVYDEDAATEEPTRSAALILVTAKAQTDKGLRRKRNEDSILALTEYGVFAVADGMGGYQGGEIASALAVKTIEAAFRSNQFAADPHEGIPPRASELARAIQMANEAILEKAQTDPTLSGMGTTICAIRFAPNKKRLYVGHVGDSRLYRIRDGELRRMTSDHTMKDFGVSGPQGAHLSRAVGVWPTVAIDVVLGVPAPGDYYILCSDGLTKMVRDEEIARIAKDAADANALVEQLVHAANANGGKDNISVVAIHVVSAAPAADTAP